MNLINSMISCLGILAHLIIVEFLSAMMILMMMMRKPDVLLVSANHLIAHFPKCPTLFIFLGNKATAKRQLELDVVYGLQIVIHLALIVCLALHIILLYPTES